MARRSLADMVPTDLPEDVQIPAHGNAQREAPKATTRGAGAVQGKKAQAAAETATDDAEPLQDDAEPDAAPERPRSQRRTSGRAVAPADDGVSYPRRVTLPLTDDDYKALKRAHLDDDVNTVTRLRAMVDLWQTNSRVREQIDRHARRIAR
jgi:hypothetical protein